MKLQNKKIAIIATDGFEESELLQPKQALIDEGAEVSVISNKSGNIKGWKEGDWSGQVEVDQTLAESSEEQFDGLLIPGGVINPDQLRREEQAVTFVRDFFKSGKPVGAICHGPQLLIEAEVVEKRRMTSFGSIKKDLVNAGAQWEDSSVVTDEGLVTSRSPQDLNDFIPKLIEEFAEGKHKAQRA